MSFIKKITDFFKQSSFFRRSNKKEEVKVSIEDLENRLFALEDLVIKQSYVISTFSRVQDEIFTFLLGRPRTSADVKNTSLKSQKIFISNKNDDDDLIN
jgi:LPS O-antigen subunit length determinant protein (WzzB/FepE family)